VHTDIALDPVTQRRAFAAMSLPAGQSLERLLPPELYARVDRYVKGRGASLVPFQSQKIWVLASLLPMLRFVGAGPALDQVLFDWATAHGKRTAGLETVQMQVGAMEVAGREGELGLLRGTLEFVERAAAEGRDPMDEMLELYLAGDVERIAERAFAFIDPEDAVLGRLRTALIDQRNARMVRTIEDRLRAEPDQSHFFAVGALHYPGETGILAQLRERGLRLSRIR